MTPEEREEINKKAEELNKLTNINEKIYKIFIECHAYINCKHCIAQDTGQYFVFVTDDFNKGEKASLLLELTLGDKNLSLIVNEDASWVVVLKNYEDILKNEI